MGVDKERKSTSYRYRGNNGKLSNISITLRYILLFGTYILYFFSCFHKMYFPYATINNIGEPI